MPTAKSIPVQQNVGHKNPQQHRLTAVPIAPAANMDTGQFTAQQ